MRPDMTRVTMGLLFYPRGGSAQVVRYLMAALRRAGENIDLVTGSLGPVGSESNASNFYGDLNVHAIDYTAAVEAFDRGEDPMDAPVPIHPSYEDRHGVPDRIFTSLNDAQTRRQMDLWRSAFVDAGCANTDVFHLHHLTPQHLAVRELWPDRPVVTHLHGTEMKMLDTLSPADPWAKRLVGAARASKKIITISPHDRDEAIRLLGVDAQRVEIVANGVDTNVFDRKPASQDGILARWKKWLVSDPRGWDETGRVGSVGYNEEDLAAFVDGNGDRLPVLIFVGRFLGFKRVPLLVRAYADARHRMATPVPLVIWGGSPGEWEGEHPVTVARQLRVEGVFFTGWRGHDELPDALNSADVMVAPSTDEPFGQVYLEAMASGLPVIATRSGGPPTFVNTDATRPNGWLVAPDDLDALSAALVEAVEDSAGRIARGNNGYEQIRRYYSWDTIARRVAAIHTEVAAGG